MCFDILFTSILITSIYLLVFKILILEHHDEI